MTDYSINVHIAATPEQVYDVLTDASQFAKWWTPASGSAAAGGELRFSFDGLDAPVVLNVTEATPSVVAWDIVDGAVFPEWVGTRPVFELTAADGGCDLSFRHEGLTSACECYQMCAAGWNQYLPGLGAYVETGAGDPYTISRLGKS